MVIGLFRLPKNTLYENTQNSNKENNNNKQLKKFKIRLNFATSVMLIPRRIKERERERVSRLRDSLEFTISDRVIAGH